MKSTLRTVHRGISLGVATLWLLQALSGVFLVFHWEFDDALVAGAERPFDLESFGERLDALETGPPRRAIASIWATAGKPDRFEITVDDTETGESTILRVDGEGDVLRARASAERWGRGGWIKQLASFHQNLLAGDVGHSFIGLSGLLLLTNIVLGLKLAWPARGRWARTLRPRVARLNAAGLYAWHRALGLWVAPLALITVTCGTLLTFEDKVGVWIRAQPIEPAASATTESGLDSTAPDAGVAPGTAIGTALGRYPGATLAGVQFPDAESPWYRIRVLQPGESRRVFGTTTVFVSAQSGRVLGDFDALTASPARKFMDTLFPIHTGEIGGLAGRLVIVVIGLWLLTMIGLGVSLWAKRRPKSAGDQARAGINEPGTSSAAPRSCDETSR
jgi:uncharacterized iron-regulated membrane protein